jgi:acetyl esterase/lipase
MKRIIIIVVVCLVNANVKAQSWPGLTGKPDTSYNNGAAYRSVIKNYPDAILVPEQHSPDIEETRNVSYCSIQTDSTSRYLAIDEFSPEPKRKDKKRTAIIIIHGGGWRSGNRTQHYALAQHLARLGYVCFTPEYRLSTEALFPAAVYDIKAAVKWVKSNAKYFYVDTNKIAILGFSAGGELAAFVGATNGDTAFEDKSDYTIICSNVQAVIDIDGTLSFVHHESGEGDDSKKISAATNWLGASKKDNPELWKQASPLTHAGKNTPPTLFINSSIERMHAGRNDYIKILTENNIYTEVKTFENSPHHFCLMDPWFEPTVKYIDEFLKKIFTKQPQ